MRAAVPRVLPDASRWKHGAAKSHGALRPRETEEKKRERKAALRRSLPIFPNYDQSPEGRMGQEAMWERIFRESRIIIKIAFRPFVPLFTEVWFPKRSKVPRCANFAAAATSRNNQHKSIHSDARRN